MPKRLPFFRQGSEDSVYVESTDTLVDQPQVHGASETAAIGDATAFVRRDSVFCVHHTSTLGVKILLPDPTVPPPPSQSRRVSVRQTGNHLPPVSPRTPSAVNARPHGPHVASFIPQLRIPLLPLIHLLLISTHLALAACIPYLLVKHMIQPILLWLILAVCLSLQTFYLAPGIILEIIGLSRRRPV